MNVAALETRREHRRGQAYVLLAAVAWSTAGLLQRELDVDTATQVAGRAVFAFLALVAYGRLLEPRGLWRSARAAGWAGVGFAVCLAVASSAFIVALNHTTVANVLFMQAVAPVLAAALGGLLLAEPVGRRAWVAMTVALVGVGVMVGGPGRVGAEGDALAFVMSLAFAGTIVLARRRRDISMAPATCLAQLMVLAATAPFAHPGRVDGRDLALLAALGVCQMGLGLALFTVGARLIPAAEVALISLLEVVLGPIWVMLVRSERPGAATLVGGAVVVAAVVLQARATPQRPEG